DRVKRAARPLLGLEQKHAPTVAGQRRGCHEPVRASAHHDGIEHACDPGWLRIRRTAPYARGTVRLYGKCLLLRLLGLFDDDIGPILEETRAGGLVVVEPGAQFRGIRRVLAAKDVVERALGLR